MNNKQIIDNVYQYLFSHIQTNEINIFLCGKSSDSESSIRSKIHNSLSKHARLNVIFPEWLFANLLENSDQDLLTLETFLAKNVDKILLPLEGPGSFCELGSFVMNEIIRSKLIVINEDENNKKPSFINKGPIRLIRKTKVGSLLLYNKDSIQKSLLELENKILYGHYDKSTREELNLFSLSTFIAVLIGVFQPISNKKLGSLIFEWNDKITDLFIDPVIEILVEKKFLTTKQYKHKDEILELTELGFNHYYIDLFKYISKIKIFTKLRAISFWRIKKDSSYSFQRRKARLLD